MKVGVAILLDSKGESFYNDSFLSMLTVRFFLFPILKSL